MVKLLLVAVALVVGVVSADTDAGWVVFKATYGKVYDDNTDAIRRRIYEDNLKKIQEHNVRYAKGLKTFFMGENEFSDLTHEEFVKTMNGLKRSAVPTQAKDVDQDALKSLGLPSQVDWRTKGYVTTVKNQGNCGSCWAFSATGSLEGAHFKKTGKLVSLAEQNLMDCSGSYGNSGCDGGFMVDAFKYIIANKGIDSEMSYPYRHQQGPCRFKRENVSATESSYVVILSGSELALQNASATVGPISVGMDASEYSFKHYKGGVYYEPLCSSEYLDHGVLVVGYGTENGHDYWLVKNSWGSGWGINGYVKMSRNRYNNCGIATRASYPVV